MIFHEKDVVFFNEEKAVKAKRISSFDEAILSDKRFNKLRNHLIECGATSRMLCEDIRAEYLQPENVDVARKFTRFCRIYRNHELRLENSDVLAAILHQDSTIAEHISTSELEDLRNKLQNEIASAQSLKGTSATRKKANRDAEIARFQEKVAALRAEKSTLEKELLDLRQLRDELARTKYGWCPLEKPSVEKRFGTSFSMWRFVRNLFSATDGGDGKRIGATDQAF